MHSYVATQERYPQIFDDQSWTIKLLPHLDQPAAYQAAEVLGRSDEIEVFGSVSRIQLEVFACPVEAGQKQDEYGQAYGTYAYNSQIGLLDSQAWTDGFSNTVMLLESHNYRDAWIHGPMRETYIVDTPHISFLKILFGDGSVRQMAVPTDTIVLKAIGTPNGGETVSVEQP